MRTMALKTFKIVSKSSLESLEEIIFESIIIPE
jgi:hypothetical protein